MEEAYLASSLIGSMLSDPSLPLGKTHVVKVSRVDFSGFRICACN